MTKIAINGFGRIGRLALRYLQGHEGIEVVAVNDLTDAEMLAHLFKYDSAQGPYRGEVKVEDGNIIVDGQTIRVYEEADPANLPWADLGVEVVLECTGFFNSKEKASKHIEAGAQRVLLSAPGGDDVPTVVYGVNHQDLDPAATVVSAASCTTNCLAPMVNVLHREYRVVEGLMSTIHAYTGDQNLVDGPHRKGNKRRARSAAENIIPTSTGAAKAIGNVIPELKGKLNGTALRVPVVTGSITELYTVLAKEVSVDQVNAAMKAAESESFGYNEDEIVSSDIIGMHYGSLFDATLTQLIDVDGRQMVKTVAWYDNEMSYVAQLVRTLEHLAQ